MPELPELTYPTLRALAVQAAVVRALRRCGAWLLMALGLLAAVSNTPDVALAGLASVMVPLWWAAGPGGAVQWLLWAGVTGVYALLGWAWLRAWRGVLWPIRWREQEASLPLPQGVLDQTDRRLLALMLAPLAGCMGCAWGLLWIWHKGPALAQAGRAALGVGLALGLSLWVGRASLRRWRRQALAPWAGAAKTPCKVGVWGPRSAAWALVLAPLWRGCAPLSRQALLLGQLLPPLALLVAVWGAMGATLWLCLASTVALACTALAMRRLTLELADLHGAAPSLPLASRTLARWRSLVALAPIFSAVAALAMVSAIQALPLRSGPALGLALSLACAGGLETLWPMANTGHHACRWLLMLSVCLAFASELT